MIRSLRHRHRTMFLILSPLMALTLFLGVTARKPVPRMDQPLELMPTQPAQVFETTGAFGDITATVRGNAGTDVFLEITLDQDPKKPDLLVYWNDGGAPADNKIPQTAILLGAVPGSQPRTFKAPNAAAHRAGGLIFYSLAHDERIGTMALPAVNGGTP